MNRIQAYGREIHRVSSKVNTIITNIGARDNMINIEFKIDSKELGNGLEELARRCVERQPLMRHIAGIMESAVQDNFAAGGRPKWLPVARGGKPLTLSGHLANSISSTSDNDYAIVGTNVPYAGIHNFGGKTKPHMIYPKHKKALAFNGRVVKKVNHPGSKIPQREFLVLTDEEYEEINHAISNYLAGNL